VEHVALSRHLSSFLFTAGNVGRRCFGPCVAKFMRRGVICQLLFTNHSGRTVTVGKYDAKSTGKCTQEVAETFRANYCLPGARLNSRRQAATASACVAQCSIVMRNKERSASIKDTLRKCLILRCVSKKRQCLPHDKLKFHRTDTDSEDPRAEVGVSGGFPVHLATSRHARQSSPTCPPTRPTRAFSREDPHEVVR